MANFENMELVRLLMKRRISLLAIFLFACTMGYVFSGPYFIQPKYKSTAILYPVNIIPYSMESPTEQLLQLTNSADVRSMMIKRFDLASHYKIDTNKTAGKTKLHNQYDENVAVRKTEFESIKIDILDADPDTACKMVVGIIESVNIKARALQRDKTKEVVLIYQRQLDEKQRQIDSLQRMMNELRVRYGLLDYESQSKEATKSYLKLVSTGASRDKLREVDSLMRNLEEKGGSLVALNSQLTSLQNAFNSTKIDYDRAVSDMTKELTYSNVVTKPIASDAKAYPVRSLIVFICGFSAFLLTLILFTILERTVDGRNSGK